MAQRVQVPRFGNWEGEANVPYTICFDKASIGRSRGETKRPSSHASPARSDPCSENERPTEKDLLDIKLMKIARQQHMDVPKFGDWYNQGDGVPYTVYFEKVRERGSHGRTTCISDKSAQDAYVPARREPLEEKYIRYQTSPRSGGIAHGEIMHESKNSLEGCCSSASSKIMSSRRSPDSKHRNDSRPLSQNQARVGAMVKGHVVSERRSPARDNIGISCEPHLRTNTSRDDEVVPSTAIPKYVPSGKCKLSSSNGFPLVPSKVAADGNSTYHNVPMKTKEQKADPRQKCCFPWSIK